MFCGNCGTEIQEGVSVCPNCGAAVAAAQAPVQEAPVQEFTGSTAFEQPVAPAPMQSVQGFDPNVAAPAGQQYYPYQQMPIQYDSALSTVIKVFMILGTLGSAILIVPLFWCIPMTVVAFKSLDEGRPIGTGFKVCTLLFVNLIAGICMLCLKENNYNQYNQY